MYVDCTQVITSGKYCIFEIKPKTLMQVPNGRAESADACTKTVHNQTKALSTVCNIASCGDRSLQLGAEVKA